MADTYNDLINDALKERLGLMTRVDLLADIFVELGKFEHSHLVEFIMEAPELSALKERKTQEMVDNEQSRPSAYPASIGKDGR